MERPSYILTYVLENNFFCSLNLQQDLLLNFQTAQGEFYWFFFFEGFSWHIPEPVMIKYMLSYKSHYMCIVLSLLTTVDPLRKSRVSIVCLNACFCTTYFYYIAETIVVLLYQYFHLMWLNFSYHYREALLSLQSRFSCFRNIRLLK